MSTQQKRLVILRHGKVPQKPEGGSEDFLYDSSAKDLYEKGKRELGPMLAEHGITLDGVRLDHSDAQRTNDTGMAYLAGAFGVQPMPESTDQLRGLTLDGLLIAEDPRLGIGEGESRIKFNMTLVKAWGADGNHSRYLDFWASQPDATELEGQPVTPFSEMIVRGKSYLVDALGYLLRNEADVVVTATHGGGICEPIIMAAVGTRLPSEIGGAFGMEENAHLVLDAIRGGNYTARLERSGQTYNVDLQGLMN